MKITFLGATQEVTGSKYLIEHEKTKILVDCGLFQGKNAHKRNRERFPINPKSINAIVLTHAHIDHTGYIPVLVKKGFSNPIYCTPATYELCKILLIDSGFVQEQNAKKRNAHAHDDDYTVEPLYTKIDAENALRFFKIIDFDTNFTVAPSLNVTFKHAGHILGASFVLLSNGKQTITFSGDLGRPNQLTMKGPAYPKQTDFLIVESTYGDKVHEKDNSMETLGTLISQTVAKKGAVIIPVFAVGRAQMILYCLYQLRQQKIIPNIPIFLDSPMAIAATDLFCEFPEEHTIEASLCKQMFDIATHTPTVQDSKKLNQVSLPAIIVAGSGMADGGRILYHFQHFISNPKNMIIFVGFQAHGTIGRELVDGAKTIKLDDIPYEVHAQIHLIDSFSAHADSHELLEWLSHFEHAPKKVFITHGELEAAQGLKEKIEKQFGWQVVIPKYAESFELE